MKILLTGDKGFIGSELKTVLTDENAHEVDGFDTFDYGVFRDWFNNTHIGQYDLVIHCGAVSDSRRKDNDIWSLNYFATCQLADACERHNVKMIFISSAAAWKPSTPYAWTKNCAEFYLNHRIAGMNLTILRPFNVWDFDESKKANPSIVYKIITGKLPYIYRDCIRDFVSLTDVVSGIQQAVLRWTPGTFDLGTTEPTEILCLVEAISDAEIPITPCPIETFLVAAKADLLPDWEASPITEHYVYLREQVREHSLMAGIPKNDPEYESMLARQKEGLADD